MQVRPSHLLLYTAFSAKNESSSSESAPDIALDHKQPEQAVKKIKTEKGHIALLPENDSSEERATQQEASREEIIQQKKLGKSRSYYSRTNDGLLTPTSAKRLSTFFKEAHQATMIKRAENYSIMSNGNSLPASSLSSSSE